MNFTWFGLDSLFQPWTGSGLAIFQNMRTLQRTRRTIFGPFGPFLSRPYKLTFLALKGAVKFENVRSLGPSLERCILECRYE